MLLLALTGVMIVSGTVAALASNYLTFTFNGLTAPQPRSWSFSKPAS